MPPYGGTGRPLPASFRVVLKLAQARGMVGSSRKVERQHVFGGHNTIGSNKMPCIVSKIAGNSRGIQIVKEIVSQPYIMRGDCQCQHRFGG